MITVAGTSTIDVSSQQLDIFIHELSKHWSTENSPAGIKQLQSKLHRHKLVLGGSQNRTHRLPTDKEIIAKAEKSQIESHRNWQGS